MIFVNAAIGEDQKAGARVDGAIRFHAHIFESLPEPALSFTNPVNRADGGAAESFPVDAPDFFEVAVVEYGRVQLDLAAALCRRLQQVLLRGR